MKISVIIPCFNAADTLGQQLWALANQTIEPWEVIVSDNGSTDDFKSVIKQYKSCLPHLIVVDAHSRRGAAHARNVGAQQATGDYLAFCDADDIVSTTWLEGLIQALSASNFVASRMDWKTLNSSNVFGVQENGLQTIQTTFTHAGGCGLAIKKSIHEAVGGFDESMNYLEDMEYCLKVQFMGEKLEFAPEAVVFIRARSTPSANFKQARNWGFYYVSLCKKYQNQGLNSGTVIGRLLNIGCYLLNCVWQRFKVRDTVWGLGWEMGNLQGYLHYGIVQFLR